MLAAPNRKFILATGLMTGVQQTLPVLCLCLEPLKMLILLDSGDKIMHLIPQAWFLKAHVTQMRSILKTERYRYVFTSRSHGDDEDDHENPSI